MNIKFELRGRERVRVSPAGDALHDPRSRHVSFGLAHVTRAEQKLTVEVGHVDGVHVDDVDLLEAR